MGERGFPKKGGLHLAKGAADEGRRKDFTPQRPPAYLPEEPDWHPIFRNKVCEADAHAEWGLTVTELFRRGVLTRTDASAAVDYCICHARVAYLERRLSGRYTIKGKDGMVSNPLTSQLRHWSGRLQALRKDLGLTPMSRLRLGIEEEKPPDDDSDLDEPLDAEE